MKHFLLISIFCLSKVFAQVGPPSLRCLQVDQNGDVTLIWLPPSDPGGTFDSYDVYFSLNNATAFSFLANVAGPITNTTYVHMNAGAHQQSIYYYVVSRSGATGSLVSTTSDTLRTIFLNLNPGNGSQEYLKISYNNLRQPKLASTNSSFSILKEYPIGTWGSFANTTALSYNDTLSVCQASLNYQVRVLDNSGCFSSSNYQGGVFNDKKDPAEPVIDSISVLPNGNVVLAWHVPADKDISKYRIYQLIASQSNTINSAIDTVNGRNNTFYTFFTTLAYGQSISLFLSSIDSCQRISPFTNTGGTMNIKLLYDQCNYKSVISWNPYKNMPKGLGEYKVYYSQDAGATFSVIGVTKGTSFTHSGVAPDKNICYYVRAVNTDKTITSSSNQHCFFSRQVASPAFVYISSASVLADKTVELKLYLDTTKFCKGVDLYRSADGGNFSAVGFVPVTGKSKYSFVDKLGLDTDSSSYFYRGTIKDSCGNTRSTSNVAKTVLLKVAEDREFIFTKHISWSDYLGFAGGVSGYNIYRIVNGQTPQLVGNSNLLGNTYTDDLEQEAANGSSIEYMVEAIEGQGNPYGFVATSSSNRMHVYVEGRIFVPTAFSPTGRNKIWRPVTHFIDKKDYSVKVFNRWGQKVFETSDDTIGWDGDEAAGGIYAYVISYKNARGEYLELKGTFILL